MKRVIKIIIIALVIILGFSGLNKTLAYYNADVGLTNIFETEKYKFSINATGGSFNKDTVIIDGKKVSLPTPIRKGYTFLGFSSSNSGKVEYTNYIDDVKIINNKNIFAKWDIIHYQISYDLDGGSISKQPLSYTVEDNISLPTPNKRGYEFLGWTGTDWNTMTKNVVISKGNIGNKNYKANWKTVNYSISYNLNGGSIVGQPTSYTVKDKYTLPTPSRTGYIFSGWTGSDINGTSMNVSVSNSIGNKSYTANWSKNYYTVNYYVNGNLWTQRSVGYGDSIENLNAQSLLDIYHTFHGWNNWVDYMPNYDISLTANITESYCSLMTGHGPYDNAATLLKVFQDAGWSGRIEKAPAAPGNYWVVTDYNLTRAQAEQQKQYIASHTNYTNYNFPYLYWVGVSCTNGYSEAWTRPKGQQYFN